MEDAIRKQVLKERRNLVKHYREVRAAVTAGNENAGKKEVVMSAARTGSGWCAAAVCVALGMLSARAGSLDAPAPPTDPASAMWTLNDIYNVLDTRTTNVTKRTAFREPTAGPTSGTMYTLNDIMALVTNRAPVPKTGQTNSYLAGDDGTYQKGVSPSPRFTIQSNTNVVKDNLTGLMWARDMHLPGTADVNWTNAVNFCESLDYGGYTDWRLPNVKELGSLLDHSRYSPMLPTNHPFNNVQNADYWSSTTFVFDTSVAWTVGMRQGETGPWILKSSASRQACPVRGP